MESLLGRTEDVITPEVRKFEGYISPQPQTGQIQGGKVLVIEYLYEREVHTLQLENNDGTEPKHQQMKQGAAIPAPSMRKGYTFMGWYGEETVLGITIDRESWKKAPSGSYADTVTFQISYVDATD